MTELVDGLFLLWGFIDGDCLTVRPELFDTEAAFRFDFRAAIELELTVGVLNSMLASTGDVVSEVSELRTAPLTECWFACLCASKAGEVRGLKYSPGTGYSGYWNWVSTGVTAGETKGVKIIL